MNFRDFEKFSDFFQCEVFFSVFTVCFSQKKNGQRLVLFIQCVHFIPKRIFI